MRKLIIFFLLVSAQIVTKAQKQTQYLGSSNTRIVTKGELQIDSLFVLPNRTDTNFVPYKSGAIIFRVADRRNYFHDGIRWRQMADNTNPVWVDTLYSVNDSTIRWTKNGQVFNLQIKGGRKENASFSASVLNDSSLAISYDGQVQLLQIKGSQMYKSKIENIYKSNDSVYLVKEGVRIFAFMDSGGAGTSETASNVGNGTQVFKSKVGNDFQFRTLMPGNSNISFTQNSNDIVISAKSFLDSLRKRSDSVFVYKDGIEAFAYKDSVGAGGSGSTETASNIGTGQGVYKQKTGDNLEFKSLVSDFGLQIINNANDLTLKVDTSLDIATKTMVNQKSFFANSISDLKLKNPNNGGFAITLGYYNPNDGGGAKYRWNSSSTATADDVLIVAATGIATGRWELIVEGGKFNIKWAGAKGDNSSELAAINKAFQVCSANGWTLYGSGVYNMNNGTIVVNDGINIEGGFTLRNGSYINIKKSFSIKGVRFQNFSTAAIYYPTGSSPAADVTVVLEDNVFDSCYYALNSQSAWAVGTEMVNTSLSNNRGYNIRRGFFNPRCDMINSKVDGNYIDGVMSGGSEYRNLIVLGQNGTINTVNFSRNLSVQNNTIKNITFPQNASDVSNQCVSVDAASATVSFNKFYEVKCQNIYFSVEDGICQGNIHINDTTRNSEQAIIAKNGTYQGTSKVMDNVIRGYFKSGIYYDSKTKLAEIINNTIDIKDSSASVGDAGIRYQNYGNADLVKISGNYIAQSQPNTNVTGIQIGSAYKIGNTIIENNVVKNRTTAFSIYGPTSDAGVNVVVKNNTFQSRFLNYVYGDNITFEENEIIYPVDTAANHISIGPRFTANIVGNTIKKDTLTATAFVSNIFYVPNAASRVNANLNFKDNYIDPSRASNVYSFENPVNLVDIAGDKLVSPIAGAYLRFFSNAKGVRVRLNNITSHGTTGTTIQTSTADTAKIDVYMNNSTFMNSTFLANSNNSVRDSLVIDNSMLASTPAVLTGWAFRRINLRGGGNISTTTSNKTLAFSDVIEGRDNVIRVNSSSTTTITIPPNTSVVLPLSTPVTFIQEGTGAVQLNAGAGVTINTSTGLVTKKRYQAITAVQTATDVWTLALPPLDTAGGGGGGGSDNWGSQVVVTDGTLTGQGTSGFPLKVDTADIATKSYVNSINIAFSSSAVNGFKGNGSDTALTTVANMSTNETTTVDGQLMVASGTNGGVKMKKFTSNGFLKQTGSVVVSQAAINLTSDVTGLLPVGSINATGTPSSTTYLRGDGTWATVSSSSGLGDPGANGITVRTALNTTAARSIGVGTDLSITNADGVSGNPTISLGSNVARLNAAQTWTAQQDIGLIKVTGALMVGTSAAWDNNAWFVNAGSGISTTAASFQYAGSSNIVLRRNAKSATTISLSANQSYIGTSFGGETVAESSSGSHTWMTNILMRGLSVTGGSATVENTSILFIDNPATATVSGINYGIYAEGLNRFAQARIGNLSSGVVMSDSDGDLSSVATLPIANGGTNASTANGALNNLLPVQTGSAGKVLTTNGTNASWGDPGGYSVITGVTTTNSLNNLGTINIPTGTDGVLEMYVIARNVVSTDVVNSMKFKRYYGFTKNNNGLLMHSSGTDAFSVSSSGYTPGFSFLMLSNNFNIRVASSSTETTEWTVYYKIFYNVLNY